LCKGARRQVRDEVKTPFTAIVSPAVGGIVPGYEMGRQLGLPAVYVERVEGSSSCAAISPDQEPAGAEVGTSSPPASRRANASSDQGAGGSRSPPPA